MSEKRGGLLPCPFCNALGYWIGGLAGYKIKCTNTECGAQSDLTEVSHEAIKRWNRRAAPAAVEPAIARDFGEFDRERTRAHEQSAAAQQRPATTPTAEEVERTPEGLTRLGNESFNIPAILRGLQRELADTWGGSERTQIALVIRLIERLAAAQHPDWGTLQDDLGEILRALGMFDGARPESPHAVFQKAIVEIKRLAAAQREQVPRDPTREMIKRGCRTYADNVQNEYEEAVLAVWYAMRNAWDASQRGAEIEKGRKE